jgi:hypothetical protein
MGSIKNKKKQASADAAPSSSFIPSFDGGRVVLAVDQSLSSTGVAVLAPVSSMEDCAFVARSVFELSGDAGEARFRADGSLASLASSFARLSQKISPSDSPECLPIYVEGRWASGPRKKKKMLVGALVRSRGRLFILLSSVISCAASAEPERLVARRSADLVAAAASKMVAYAADRYLREVRLSFECLAMGGSAGTTRILPVLGVVWAAMFDAMDMTVMLAPESVLVSPWEFPISSWKKDFTGRGNAKKTDVETALFSLLGLSGASFSLETSDESDAMAMGFLLMAGATSAARSDGRIRPKPTKS